MKRSTLAHRSMAAFALAGALLVGGASAHATPVQLTGPAITLDAPTGWTANVMNDRIAQISSSTGIKIDVMSPPSGATIEPVLELLRDGPRRGLTWSAVSPATVGTFPGSTQRATGTVDGAPTTFVQTWVSVRNRLVVFTLQFPTQNAASAEASARAVINTLRAAR